jgi:hypothetical protein
MPAKGREWKVAAAGRIGCMQAFTAGYLDK